MADWEPVDQVPWATQQGQGSTWEPVDKPPWEAKPAAPEEKPSQHPYARAARASAETFMGGARAAAKPFEPLYHWATGDEEAMKKDREAARNPLTSLKETGAALMSPLTMTVGTVAAFPTSVLASGMGEVSRAGQRAIKAGAEYISPELGKKVPQPQTSEEAYEAARPGAEAAMSALAARPGIATTSKMPMPDFRIPTTTTTTKTVPGVGAEAEAGRFLESQAKDPAAFRAKLQQPAEEIAGPGDKPTTFEHTGELSEQTREAARRPGQVSEHQQRRTEQTQAQIKALEDLQPGGTPTDVSAHLRRVMETENAQADSALQAAQQLGEAEVAEAQRRGAQGVTAAQQRGAQAVEELGGTYDPTTYGNIKRRSLEDAHEVTRAYERALWERIDPNLPTNPQPLQVVERRIYGVMREGGAEEASLSPAERQLSEVISTMPPQGVPFKELRVLRSTISAELRKELVTNGQTPAYARLSQLRAGIEGAIADSVPPEVYAQVREATAVSAQRAQTFRAPGVKEVLRREGVQGPYRVGEASVPDQFIRAGPSGYDRASNYLRAVPTGLEEFADAVAAKARRTVINPDGSVNPTKLQTFLRQHQETLRAIDERDGGVFSARLRNLGAAQEGIEAAEAAQTTGVKTAQASSKAGVEAAEANRAAITKKYQGDTFKSLIGVENDADASNIIGNIFGKQDRVTRAQELMQRVKGNPAGVEGARAAVTRYVREKFLTMATAGDDPALRSQAFQRWVSQNKDALGVIMDPAQVQRLENIARSLQRSARLNQTKAVGGGSDTYQMQQAGKAQKGAVREMAGKIVPTALEYLVHAAAHALGGLPGLAVSLAGKGAIAAKLAKRAAMKAATEEERIKLVQGLIDDAILNPEKARELLGKTTTTETKTTTRTPQARGVSAYEAGVHTQEGEDERAKRLRLTVRPSDKKPLPRQAGGGVPAIGGTGGRSPGARETSRARAARQGAGQALADGGEAGQQQAAPVGFRERHAAALAGSPAGGPFTTKAKGLTALAREDVRRTLQQFGITDETWARQLGERDVDSRATGGGIDPDYPTGERRTYTYPEDPSEEGAPDTFEDRFGDWKSDKWGRQKGMAPNPIYRNLRDAEDRAVGNRPMVPGEIVPNQMYFGNARAFDDGGGVEDEKLPLPGQSRGLRSAGPTVTSTMREEDIPKPITNRAGETLPTYILKSWGKGLGELMATPGRVYKEGMTDEDIDFGPKMAMTMTGMGRGQGTLGIGRSGRRPPRPPREEPTLEAGEVPAADRPVSRSHNMPPEVLESIPPPPPPRRTSSLGLRDMPLDKAIEQARTEQHLIPSRMKEGYVGAPNWVKTPEDLAKLRADFDAQVARGLMGAKWYEEAQGGIKHMAGPEPAKQHQLSQELALTSAQANPDTNLGFALQGHNAIMAGKPLDIVRTGQQAETLREGIRSGEIKLGRKTGIYARHMDPTMENPSTGTNDIWHARALGYENPEGGLHAAEHAFMDAETVLAVDRANKAKLGGRSDWTPGEIQAAPWVAGKAEGLREQFGWTPERALAEAVKTYPQHFNKYTAFGTHEATPGVGTRHLPRVAEGSEAERAAFAADPRSFWRDPSGRDILYRGLSMWTRPSTKATGIYEGPKGLEVNPAEVARPMVGFTGKAGERVVDPASRRLLDAAEAARAYVDVQNAGAWSIPIAKQKTGLSTSAYAPRPGGAPLPIEDVGKLQAIGGRHGLPGVIDYGEGTALTSFGDGPTGKQLGKSTLPSEVEGVLGVRPDQVRLDTGYIDYSSLWGKTAGSGAVTRELRKVLMNKEAPDIIRRLDASPELRQSVAAKLARDAEIAERTGQPIRGDVQLARQIIVDEGFAGLFRALKQGAALPALVFAPLVQLLSQDRGE